MEHPDSEVRRTALPSSHHHGPGRNQLTHPGRRWIEAKTLRYYEDVGLLPDPDRSPAGYRDYGPEVLDRLHFIRRGQAAGLTLAQIGQVLAIRDRGQAPCQHVTDLLDTRLAVIDRQLAELAQLRTTIAILREHATTGDPATCSPEDVCRYL